jgi:DNA (cytosine-5)-methyltransferase 1
MSKFKFIDLFSGIGGFRIALEELGGECVFSSDVDKWANQAYFENFGDLPSGDITKIKSGEIPKHDILCGGFPCQPFSIAGHRKGFHDSRGTLFFEIERILGHHKPKVVFLENVRGLLNHNSGKTIKHIKKSLEGLGYSVFYQILNSKDYGVPQNRERIYIVGFLDNLANFSFPKKEVLKKSLNDIIKNGNGKEVTKIAHKNIVTHLKNYELKNPDLPLIVTEIRPSRCVFRNDGISPCLTAKMGTGGNNVPVIVGKNRRFTVDECLAIQGFPEWFKLKNDYYKSYKQIGNSVSVPVIKKVGFEIVKQL